MHVRWWYWRWLQHGVSQHRLAAKVLDVLMMAAIESAPFPMPTIWRSTTVARSRSSCSRNREPGLPRIGISLAPLRHASTNWMSLATSARAPMSSSAAFGRENMGPGGEGWGPAGRENL